MDPFTLALATFGIQKLRGKSTRTALKDAALVGGTTFGIGQIGGMSRFAGTPFASATQGFRGGPLSGIQALLPGGTKEAALESTGKNLTGIYRDLPATQFPGADGITSYGDSEIIPKFDIKENLAGKAKKIVEKAKGDESKIYELIEAQKGKRNAVEASDIFEISGFGEEQGVGMERGKILEKAFEDKALYPDVKPTGILGKAKQFYDDLTPGQKFLGATVGIPAVAGLFEDETPVEPPFTEEDYEKAYQKQRQVLEGGFVPATNTRPALSSVFANSADLGYATGGIIEIKKFNKGGVNYLPSKSDHNENDANNYVRATGYVEDGSGNGDKDEDTMLAQLADGEFVSRADAVLGAGIMAGASPKDMKEARKKGAAFFYDQQKKLKRIYDITNASKTD